MAKNKWPIKEAVDILGNKIIKGNLVLFVPTGRSNSKDSMRAGIFLRQNRDSYSVVSKSTYNSEYIKTEMASNIFLIKDPVNYMNLPTVRDALEIVDKLTDGKHLPKSFDVNIAWGINGNEES